MQGDEDIRDTLAFPNSGGGCDRDGCPPTPGLVGAGVGCRGRALSTAKPIQAA
jgi:hypothetical protein